MRNDLVVWVMLGVLAGAMPGGAAEKPGTKLWDFATGQNIQSSPAIAADGTIYIGSDDGKLYALNSKGQPVWDFQTGANVITGPAIGADGTIYFGSLDRNFYAVKPDGKERWRFLAGGIVSSPAIGPDGTIYFGTVFNKVFALGPDSRKHWEFVCGKPLVASPAIGPDGTIYVGCINDRLYAIAPDGNRKWEFTAGGGVRSSPAIGADGTIYFGSLDMNLYALDPEGKKKWAFPTSGAIYSSPAVGPDGTIYVGSDDKKLYAVGQDGSRKWVFAAESWIRSSPAVASDGTIYVGGYDAKMYAINHDGSKQWDFATGLSVSSSPAIGADGTVYFGSKDKSFYAVQGSAPLASGPWPRFHGNAAQTGGVLPPGMPTAEQAATVLTPPPSPTSPRVEVPLPPPPATTTSGETPAPAPSQVARIHLLTQGEGRIFGAIDDQLLENGKRYVLSAEPAKGHVFTSWSGSIETNSPRLTFLMRSNLNLQANFAVMSRTEKGKPTVEITSPAENASLPNPVFSVRGIADDKVGVARVEYQVGTNDFQTASGTTQWLVRLSAQPGTNTIRVRAIDMEGNESPIASLSFHYSVMSRLKLEISGLGAINPPLTTKLLEIGKSYTLTAEPAKDYVFGGWGGGVESSSPKLTFVMQSNLLVEAHFVSKPFSRANGNYNGLIFTTNQISPETTGMFTLSVSESGGFSGHLHLGGNSHSFGGQLDTAGNGSATVRAGNDNISLNLHVDTANGTDQVVGAVNTSAGPADLLGDRQVFDGRNHKCPEAGHYTVVLPGGTNALASPAGDGFALLSVDASGNVRITGELADGSGIAQEATISKEGVLPFHVALYGGAGMIHGWLTVGRQPASDVSGKLTWIKPAGLGKEKLYPAGFATSIAVLGSLYQESREPEETAPLVGVLRGGNLDEMVIRDVAPGPGKSTGEANFKWSLAPTTGLLSGSFVHPITQKTTTFKGVFLPKQNWRSGYFLGPDQSGFVYVGTGH